MRVLILALDMGDDKLIRDWSSAGRLPNFSKLIKAGFWTDLETPTRVLHTSGWPTFATGASPGAHGVYYPYQPKPGRQTASHIGPDQYGVPTFWKTASDQGARCVVYDIPETFPDTGFKGRAVYDWGTWAWYGTPASQPAGLLLGLKQKFGPYPLGMEAKRLGLRIPETEDLERRLIDSIEYKFRTLDWLLGEEQWDLAAVGFGEPHPAGHYLWPANIGSITESNQSEFARLCHVYQALDTKLGALIAGLGGETVLMIVSGDGIRANRVACHLLGPMLEKLGYTAGFGGQGDQGQSARPRSLLGRARRVMPSGTKRWIADHLPWWLRDQLGNRAAAAEIDWSRTRAFTLPTDLEGCIRINLRGREPEGIVEPGREYGDLCKSIAADLQALVNPATGKRAVREVWIRNEVFPGERREFLPDLIVSWDDEAPFEALASPRLGAVAGNNPDRRTGTHSPEAFLLTVGPGIAAGIQGSARLVDVAPTALNLLGLKPGREMEGRAIDFETISADLTVKTV